MDRTDKVIVTNASALWKKHHTTGMHKVGIAINAMVRADRQRGLTTRVIAIDRKLDMRGIGKTVSRASDARQAKRAIDDIFRELAPDYLVILGAPDVIPHVLLRNPVPGKDEEKWVESDLPYACDAGYAREIKPFLGPTRVVGRLPDVMGNGDTPHFVRVIRHATRVRPGARSRYTGCFALSADAWSQSTAATLKRLYGKPRTVRESPPLAPPWGKGAVAGRLHFFNCHGEVTSHTYYGENARNEDHQPVAYTAHDVRKARAGTLVASECCYGAELYQPQAGNPRSIAQTYLDGGACAFFGSTNTSWGEPVGRNFADILCAGFVSAVLAGASTGRAALQARIEYIKLGGYMEAVDLKTIAQFILIGDPSVHPVTPKKQKATAVSKSRRRSQRRARRKRLERAGAVLADTTASVASRADTRASREILPRLAREVQKRGARAETIASFKLHPPKQRVHASKGRRLAAADTTFHVIVLEKPAKPVRRRGRAVRHAEKMLVVREVNGRVERVVEAVRK